MKLSILVVVLICAPLASYAQPSQNSTAPKANEADMRLLEVKIRQAWEDYKNKNKEAFARIFTSDAIEVEEGAEGPHDLKATLAEMDDFNIRNYSLSDFHYRAIGSNGMLVRYDVDYSADVRGEAIHNKSMIGEVWEKTAADWKLIYFQETKIK
jgi:hypothetical protein